METNSVLVF